jgi:hypothetical protein
MKHEFKIGDHVADVHPNLRRLVGVIVGKVDLSEKFAYPLVNQTFWYVRLDPPANVEILSPESVLEYLGDR